MSEDSWVSRVVPYPTPQSPAWNPPISGEGPELARGGGQQAHERADVDDDDDGRHGQRARHRVGRFQEDAHEGIASDLAQLAAKIRAGAEHHGDQDAESEAAIYPDAEHEGLRDDHGRIRDLFRHLFGGFVREGRLEAARRGLGWQ
jgi:hypothetical protein